MFCRSLEKRTSFFALMSPKWNFIKTPTGGVRREASDDNYFRDDSTDIVASLVRENIQNAIDAASGIEPVIVRFSLNSVPKSYAEFVKSLLVGGDDSLFDHYRKACEAHEVQPEEPEFDAPSFLLIEDFHTKGLDGYTDRLDKGGFSTFWRNAGVTNKVKGGNRGGSFGIGKVVNPMSSKLQTFFGLTIRNVEQTNDLEAGPFLLGQTMLCLHDLNDVRYEPYAIWGELVDHASGEHFETPLRDGEFLQHFIEATGLTRKKEPGLSLAVPFPANCFSAESIVEAAILHYFYPIVEGSLVVEVFKDRILEKAIDCATIKECAQVMGLEMAEAIAFTMLAQGKIGQPCDLKAHEYSLERYGESLGEQYFEPEELLKHRDRFLSGELVTVEVPIQTEETSSGQKSTSPVRLFLQKTEGKGMDYYIRNGISLHDNRCFSPSTPCLALLLSDEGEISELLRKAEGPAHTKWVQKNCKATKIYSAATKVISYVKSLLVRMHSLLGSGAQSEDSSFLADDFPDNSSLDVDSTPQVASLSRSNDGTLTVNSTREASLHQEEVCCVTMWFESSTSGRKWSPFDFNLRQMNIVSEGTTIQHLEKNFIKFRVTSNFSIKISGFDPNKDLTASVKLETP
jgi:hypothetical protein